MPLLLKASTPTLWVTTPSRMTHLKIRWIVNSLALIMWIGQVIRVTDYPADALR